MREETKRVLALPWDCDERRELSRQDHALRSKERREGEERKQRDGYEAMSRLERMAWHSMHNKIKRDERSRMREEQWRDEGEQWKEKWLWKYMWQKEQGEMQQTKQQRDEQWVREEVKRLDEKAEAVISGLLGGLRDRVKQHEKRVQSEGEEKREEEMSEKELSVGRAEREVREEVQLFGCASTAK